MSYYSDRLSHKEIGALGERIAAQFLKKNKFRVREINFKVKVGEVDIIAQKDKTLHFVEVKTLLVSQIPQRETLWGHIPEENVHERKIQQILRTAEWYLAKEKKLEEAWQVDVIAVYLENSTGSARVRYIPHVA